MYVYIYICICICICIHVYIHIYCAIHAHNVLRLKKKREETRRKIAKKKHKAAHYTCKIDDYEFFLNTHRHVDTTMECMYAFIADVCMHV